MSIQKATFRMQDTCPEFATILRAAKAGMAKKVKMGDDFERALSERAAQVRNKSGNRHPGHKQQRAA